MARPTRSIKPSARTSPKAPPTPRDALADAVAPPWAQRGERLTTAQGTPVDSTDNSIRVGERGPALLADVHLREKITHFDHERIPERVVHARGAAAHGTFRLTRSIENLSCAPVLGDTSLETPTFVRFSTVAGSRGSADTARDVRGFAVRFYTGEGNWDLVGNNMPVFFIQDGIKFPDLVHAAKPEPDREIPQAATAHDTFWDFASLAPETTHMLMWVMSDRAIPRSFRTMEGFGVHTFRLVNAKGKSTLVKFHWKPVAGMASLVWEEAQKLGGIDPDFHRRDLFDAIESGVNAEWDFGIQTFPDNAEQMFKGIDLLDPTKLVPEELAPVQIIGRLTLDRNPSNYFAETEQVAFCTSHIPRGIDFTDDPLLQARNFSYQDTQLTRLGGPNFDQLPINRPHSPVNTTQRDGFGQQAVFEGVAPYNPNSLGGGCPFPVGAEGLVLVPRNVTGALQRTRPVSFGDHFSQATLFWNSMSTPERDHIVAAFSFELGKCVDIEVRERMVGNLSNVDADLSKRVATNVGVKVPRTRPSDVKVAKSPKLSLLSSPSDSIAGKVVGILCGDNSDSAGVALLKKALEAVQATAIRIGPRGGLLRGTVQPIEVDKSELTTQSVEYDALVVAGGPGASEARSDPYVAQNLGEAYRHYKTVAAWGEGCDILTECGISADMDGVVTGTKATRAFAAELISAIALHRHWNR